MKKMWCLVIIFCLCQVTIGYTEVIDKYWCKYDLHFRKYSTIYFGKDFNYKWFKSQSYVESNFKENAISPVGAQGLMQIMPRTWREIKYKNKKFGLVSEAKWNIAGGIYYDRNLWDRIEAEDYPDRLNMMFAGYNGGLGNVYKAQKLCRLDRNNTLVESYCKTWEAVEKYAPQVLNWISNESLTYVKRIHRYME